MTHPTPLTALSPLDGRYRDKVAGLTRYFSEYGLIRYRVFVEIEWLKALAAAKELREIKPLASETITQLDELAAKFSVSDSEDVKAIEARTNHDVKAIEYWLREKLSGKREIAGIAQFIHFACTSEDVNNLCHSLMLRDSRAQVLLRAIDALVDKLVSLAHANADLPMLSRTHGQPARPSTRGKELANVVHRLRRQRNRIDSAALTAKINGAVGNYNAHLAAYPDFDWEQFCRTFVEKLGFEFNPYTTQIEPHDCIAALLDAYAGINTVLLDLDRDMWGDISIAYFKQRVKEGEVGSSTSPHNVNPIVLQYREVN